MGLDMFLRGQDWRFPSKTREESGGYPVCYTCVELGYWRKHPDLHGFIVQTFAGGVDECQRIPLNAAQLQQILEASEARTLPKTTGFFFGESWEEDYPRTKEIIEGAIRWLEEEGKCREIYYQASW